MASEADDPKYPVEIEAIVRERVQRTLLAQQQEKWVGVVNAAVEAINLHIQSDLAHPKITALLERTIAATERLERMIAKSSPDDVAKYLPGLIEREKRHNEEQAERARDMQVLTRRVTFGIPIATLFLAAVDIGMRLTGH